ncbi:hypothetical protein [Hydrogenophaga sp.]|uniref:hypothetical protein n=1 Tax=Hydrogenophaga sp. TaxID=1904254 RepID=UPI002FC9F76D
MQPTPTRRGASASARSVTPSLNLAKLVELLCKSIDSAAGGSTSHFLKVQGSKLFINTRSPLYELVTSDEFKAAFTPGEQVGFIRDMGMPGKGMVARIGGRLLHATDGGTSKALEKLQSLVAARMDDALSGSDLGAFVMPSTEEGLKVLARSVAEQMPQPPSAASMVPVVFASSDRRAEERGKDIGRVLTAVETVDGRDGLELMLKGIENKLRKDGLDDEVEETLECIRAQRNRPGSLVREFIDFLDDEALARVRLQVTMRIMEALAAQSSSPGFKEYVARVRQCYALFGSATGEALLLDAATLFGQANNSDFAEHLRKAMFYTCLSVWPQWSVQLFETRTEPTQGFATVREVSYRFRVNGNNPATGKSAFDTRMERLREQLVAEVDPHKRVKRDLAELLFLHLVTPSSLTAPNGLDVLAEAKHFTSQLRLNPRDTVLTTLASLKARSRSVDDLADELINVLKSRSNKVVSLANATADKFRISLHKDIVNWEAIDSIGPNTDILVKSQTGDNSIAWFSHLTVSEEEVVPGSLASYSVKTELQERALVAVGAGTRLPMKRDLSAPMLPVRFVPVRWSKEEQSIVPDLQDDKPFDAGLGVELHYDLSLLRLRIHGQTSEQERALKEQLRAASVTAFTLLAYVILFEVQRRLRAHFPDAGIGMLRLQHTGRQLDREADANDGNTAVYAASQAIEKALAREGFIKLQGVTTETGAGTLQWKRKGALHALLGGQRLQFPLEGSLDKVALVTYVTRPCDSHPAHSDADGYMFLSRTYVAERGAAGATLKTLYMRSRLVESRKDFKNPQPILEEIARLNELGFKHVMLLSQHFGNRHIGRAAERHAPHGTLEFMDEAVKRFPDVHLYTLRRDVFPATRLRKRDSGESGFEVVNFKDHQEMYEALGNDVLRSVMPIYTFATLAVVGEEGDRPQSGFCTYFFDVEQRITDVEMRETVRQNILGIGSEAAEVRKSLVSVLRAIHFMESEKAPVKASTVLLPVLDPYGWVNPVKRAGAGEIEAMTRRRSGSVFLSLPAVLAHVTKVLHKGAE